MHGLRLGGLLWRLLCACSAQHKHVVGPLCWASLSCKACMLQEMKVDNTVVNGRLALACRGVSCRVLSCRVLPCRIKVCLQGYGNNLVHAAMRCFPAGHMQGPAHPARDFGLQPAGSGSICAQHLACSALTAATRLAAALPPRL